MLKLIPAVGVFTPRDSETLQSEKHPSEHENAKDFLEAAVGFPEDLGRGKDLWNGMASKGGVYV